MGDRLRHVGSAVPRTSGLAEPGLAGLAEPGLCKSRARAFNQDGRKFECLQQ